MRAEPPLTKRGQRPLYLTAALLALLAGLGAGAWLLRRGAPAGPERPPTAPAEPPDPRRAYTGPYRNIDPDVHYVGDAACAACHADVCSHYAHHPMGRSLVPVADLPDRPGRGPDANNPFTALGRRFWVDREGGRTWHRQAVLDDAGKPVAELALEVRWVVGSGAKGYSYLAERDGYLLQTPISWYAPGRRWDLSPGFGPPVLAGRLVSAACLFCHANRLHLDADRPDHFRPPVFDGYAIGCERCHGPGELHVRGDLDHTIVNPARLPPVLRDAVCEQCHLEGEARILRAGRDLFDYRPGLPLSDFWAVLVPAGRGDDARPVTHVEQMYQSKCFQRPVGDIKLGCITCHDPHTTVAPAERVAYYRGRCLQCHDAARGQRGCAVPVAQRRQASAGDSCIDCHMPRYANSNVAHAASTDHRIPRRPSDRPAPAAERGAAEFVNFYQDRFPQGDPEAERTLGLGLVRLASAGVPRADRYGGRALGLLELALARRPGDDDVRAGKVEALLLLGRHAEALAAARAVLARRPGDWRLLAGAAAAAEAEGQTDLALDCWRRAAEANPVEPAYQASLVDLLLRTGRRDEARARCAQLLQADPFNLTGRQAQVALLLGEGKKEEARQAFEVIRRLRPPDLARREAWFWEQTR